jgi:hypothetical protein
VPRDPAHYDADAARWDVVVDHEAQPGDLLDALAALLLDLVERDGASKPANTTDNRYRDSGEK